MSLRNSSKKIIIYILFSWNFWEIEKLLRHDNLLVQYSIYWGDVEWVCFQILLHIYWCIHSHVCVHNTYIPVTWCGYYCRSLLTKRSTKWPHSTLPLCLARIWSGRPMKRPVWLASGKSTPSRAYWFSTLKQSSLDRPTGTDQHGTSRQYNSSLSSD